jgi:tRNA dimethylallyltransferase
LAVELARAYNGEVINCDAVQMYKGLPIITNKISREEQKGVPHHLLDCIGLDEPTWTVGKFVPHALRTVIPQVYFIYEGLIDSNSIQIEDIRGRGKLPILVGGTHYYVQSLLFDQSTVAHDDYEDEIDRTHSILEEPTHVILQKLREVDPIMANRWHPNDRRKIQRSLEIWLNTGKTASETYEAQKEVLTSRDNIPESDISAFRFDTLIFWLHASKDSLRSRLDKRVLEMVRSGLIDEVRTLYDLQLDKSSLETNKDDSRGIWIAIGYKEFADYCAALKANDGSDVQLEKLRNTAIETTQTSTKQYAKRQVRWIQYKLINAARRNKGEDRMFLLDGSDISSWRADVEEKASGVAGKFLRGEELPDPRFLSPEAGVMLEPKGADLSQSRDQWQRQVCEPCGVTAVTKDMWEKHTRSNRHREILARKSRNERLLAKESAT